MLPSQPGQSTWAEYRPFLRVLVLALVIAGVLAGLATARRASGQALLIWICLAEVALLGTALLNRQRGRRYNWLVVGSLGVGVIAAGAVLLLLA